jgi:UDP-N-acetylglucosamine 4,6-dehydratase/5-epimerase
MKSILVTGGAGSFGNAFVRRLLDMGKSDRIVIYSRGEHAQETMAKELADHPRFDTLRFFIGDVRDCDRLQFAMHDISTVVHAAALKIVPTIEYNPTEAVATNIQGAENVVKASIRSGVKRVIALSTDKAVNPVNLYGATKLAAEKIFIAANALAAGTTRFSIVRYGNVYGSRGSVVPFFRSLVAKGKALPITDRRMTRFHILMDEAIDLVLHAYSHMEGREIFIPKIPSLNIAELAEAFEVPTYEVGIRPGEKLHECLLTEDESRDTYEYDGFYVVSYGTSAPAFSRTFLKEFRYTSDTNTEWLSKQQLKELINDR